MSFKLINNVQETTDTTGQTDPYDLLGAAPGFFTFVSQLGDGDTVFYSCFDTVDLEVGIGTYVAATDKLTRTSFIFTTNGGSAVNWVGVGPRNILCGLPGEIVQSLLDPAQPIGLVERTGANAYTNQLISSVGRSLINAATAAAARAAIAALNLAGDTMTGNLILSTALKHIQKDSSSVDRDLAFIDGSDISHFGNDSGGTTLHVELATQLLLQIGAAAAIKIWHEGNDGPGSNLDADTVDGVHGSAIVFTKEFTSSEITIPASPTTLLIAHGLGGKPKLMWATLICKTPQFGYIAGDEIDMSSGWAYNDSIGGQPSPGMLSIDVFDVLNIRISWGTIWVVGKLGGGGSIITTANWKWIIRAYA